MARAIVRAQRNDGFGDGTPLPLDIETSMEIVAPGAILCPMRIDTPKGDRFIWVVAEFGDSCYVDGREIEPHDEYSDISPD